MRPFLGRLALFVATFVGLCHVSGASRSASLPNHLRNNTLWNAMKVRHERLLTAAITSMMNETSTMTNCPTNYVNTNNEYGRTGNAIIEFAHMLWFAAKTKRTAIVPHALVEPLSQFDLKTLRLVGCFIYPADMNPLFLSDTYNILHMKARELFQIEDLVKRAQELPESKGMIPSSPEALSVDLAKFVSRVFHALWCCPNQQLFDYAFHVISHTFGELRYAAIHKRGFEGSCASFITTATVNLTDAEIQLPLDAYNTIHPFRHNASYHPLCELENSFVVEIMKMHHREGIPIYVATDGQYPSDIAGTFLYQIKKPVPRGVLPAFVDILVSIHSDLFVLNPSSTFSWQVYMPRLVLGLSSIPKLPAGKDYLTSSNMPFQLMQQVLQPLPVL